MFRAEEFLAGAQKLESTTCCLSFWRIAPLFQFQKGGQVAVSCFLGRKRVPVHTPFFTTSDVNPLSYSKHLAANKQNEVFLVLTAQVASGAGCGLLWFRHSLALLVLNDKNWSPYFHFDFTNNSLIVSFLKSITASNFAQIPNQSHDCQCSKLILSINGESLEISANNFDSKITLLVNSTCLLTISRASWN